ncbi:MAG TPA: dipeptidase PepE [Thermoanaerobaculia bacterium]|nr:dipeptidase PepE [Thermoanaerobaculia bacterium]
MSERRLLLISNSTSHGSGYLDHCEAVITDFLGGVGRLLFVPFAIHDRDGYATQARQRFAAMGFEVDSLHDAAEPRRAVAEAEAVFIGGGNTFRLLKALYETGALEAIRGRVEAGMPYMGASAGTNVACPTVRTTNDMPIVEPPGFDAMGLVPFQINPHYLDPDPGSTHQGETREQRITEFLEENDLPVLGLREGTWLRVEGDAVTLGGVKPARLFHRGEEPAEHAVGSRLDFLLG